MSFSRRFLPLVLLATGCAAGATADGEDAQQSPDAIVEAAVVVADPSATRAAVVEDDRIRLPGTSGDKYAKLPIGAIFVGARGGAKNPDGFLRRVVDVTRDGSDLVLVTKAATLTDAIVSGGMNATNGTKPLDVGSELHLESASARAFDTIEIDFADEPLFENVDDLGAAKFHESIQIDRAVLSARPYVNVDLRIADRKVTRFVAVVQGDMETSVQATANVVAEGDVDEAAIAALKAKKHQVRRVIYASPRVPLPTISIGRVPVSPAVKFTVTLACDLAFGGTFSGRAGVEAKSFVRLGGVLDKGTWQAPIRSDFEIRPAFAIDRGGEIDARCAIETEAELSAYGVGGVTMSVAPYVDFSVAPGQTATALDGYPFGFVVDAGADGVMHGRNDVFGVAEADLERTLVQWKTSEPLKGRAR